MNSGFAASILLPIVAIVISLFLAICFPQHIPVKSIDNQADYNYMEPNSEQNQNSIMVEPYSYIELWDDTKLINCIGDTDKTNPPPASPAL